MRSQPPPYFFLPAFDTAGVIPAVASTFGFSFLGFLVSLLDFIWLLAIVSLPSLETGPLPGKSHPSS